MKENLALPSPNSKFILGPAHRKCSLDCGEEKQLEAESPAVDHSAVSSSSCAGGGESTTDTGVSVKSIWSPRRRRCPSCYSYLCDHRHLQCLVRHHGALDHPSCRDLGRDLGRQGFAIGGGRRSLGLDHVLGRDHHGHVCRPCVGNSHDGEERANGHHVERENDRGRDGRDCLDHLDHLDSHDLHGVHGLRRLLGLDQPRIAMSQMAEYGPTEKKCQ